MATNIVNSGDVITYSNSGSAISAGDIVVVGKCLGVALVDIAATTGTGAVQIRGCRVTVAKVSAAVIAQGEPVTWDASASAFDDSAATPATGDVQGGGAVAAAAYGNGVTSMDVILTGIPGTVT